MFVIRNLNYFKNMKAESIKSRQEKFVAEYRELRKTMKHTKAIHTIKDKFTFSYPTVSKLIPQEVVNEFITTRKMKHIASLQ